MQDTTFGENWVMGIQTLNVLFLVSVCEFAIIAKQKVRKINAGYGDFGALG